MRAPLLALALVATGCASGSVQDLPYYNSAELTPEWLTTEESGADHTVPAFALSDQRGEPITESDVNGRVVVASFFFSSCAQVCPILKNELARVQAQYLDDDRLVILSHSVMPEVDSQETLARYAELNDIDARRWHLLTGDRAEISALARDGYFVDVGSTPGDLGGYDLIHTEAVALLDGQGHIRGLYTGTLKLEMDRLLEDIETLLSEQE